MDKAMKSNSNTKNVALNSFIGILSYVFVMLITMVCRVVFTRYMGKELLGLNSLYSSVLQVLQITELGISDAILVFLYAPVKNHDREKTLAIMQLYKRVYGVVAIVLLGLGVIIQFTILPVIVDVETVDIAEVQAYFFLYLLGTVSSYIFAYSKSMFYAEQKNRTISMINAAQKVVVGTLQIIVLILIQNFYVYLILVIAGNLVENIICHATVLKTHPYLRNASKSELQKEEKRSIVELVKSVFIVRVSDKILGQSDSLLINHFVDIVTLGLYTNYNLIFAACASLFNPIGTALTTSFGNISVNADAKTKYNVYIKSYMILHFVAVLMSALYLAFIQDFIYLLYGKDFILSNTLEMLLTVYLYLTLVKNIYYSYQNAMGMQKLDQKQMILQVPCNIITSIVFAIPWGLEGILLGTVVSILIFSTGFKGRFLYERAFGKTALNYYTRTSVDGVLSLFLFLLIWLFGTKFEAHTVRVFVIKVFAEGCLILVFATLLFLTVPTFRKALRDTFFKK